MSKLAELPILACGLDKAVFSREGIVRVRAGLTALAMAALVTVAGCTSGGEQGSRPSAAATATTVHHTTTPANLAGDASPREVRARFEQLLGQHALLAVRLARSEAAKTPELQKVVETSLAANADAVRQSVGVTYDAAQAGKFEQIWKGYTDQLAAYAEASATGNSTGVQEARTALLDHCDDWGAWLADASGGRVKAAKATKNAQARVGQLMEQVDAYADRDYDRAYKLERQAYQSTYGAGTTLAKAGLTTKEAADLDKAPENLRSAFAMLLGEHMELIVDAQRATFAGAPEFESAAAQVNANTDTLATALGGIVGPKKAAEFKKAWANHVEGLMAYTAAVAGKDEAGKTVARENLDGFAERLALYFSDVVRNPLATDPLTDAITAHDEHLINQVDAYAAKDYARAQQVQDEGYQQMVGVANVLVDAIEKVMAKSLPAGGSKTGGGGTAHLHP
jgi:hypothetical protein